MKVTNVNLQFNKMHISMKYYIKFLVKPHVHSKKRNPSTQILIKFNKMIKIALLIKTVAKIKAFPTTISN